MRSDGNFGGSPNYYPNSFGGPEPKLEIAEPQFGVSGKAGRQKYIHPNDDFVQAGVLYKKVMTDADREHLVGNIVDHLGGAQTRIQYRQCAIFYKADKDYGRRVAQGLKLDPKEVARLAGLSAEDRAKETGQDAYGK
jgi:catalase